MDSDYNVYSLGAPQYYRRVFWTDYDVPDTIIDFDPSPVRVCGEQGCLITVDWTPPVDNGLPITIYEIKYRCPDGPATCPEDTIATSSQGEGYTVASLCKTDDFDETAYGCFADHPPSRCEISPRTCTTSSYTHQELIPNVEYSYAVRAYNGYRKFGKTGWSDWSLWKSYRTSSDVPLVPPVPANATVSLVTATSARVDWLVPSSDELGHIPDINSYLTRLTAVGSGDAAAVDVIFSNISLGENFALFGPGTVVYGLTPATTYDFEYAARNAEGAGPYSMPARASRRSALCPACRGSRASRRSPTRTSTWAGRRRRRTARPFSSTRSSCASSRPARARSTTASATRRT